MESTRPAAGSRDFRLHLQQELVTRCRRNPSYSLRSFARSLRISSSALSAILNGKRPLTRKTMLRLGTTLGLGLEQLEGFAPASGSRRSGKELQQLTLDAFACISEWYHFALLELIRTRSFRPDPRWVARALGLTRSEVNAAIERLERVGLLRIEADGRWVDTSENGRLTNINGELTSAASRLMQRQILEMAIRALNERPPEARSHTAVTVALDPKDLPEAKRRIQKFRRELAEFFERSRKPEEVYHLAIALYPVTQPTK